MSYSDQDAEALLFLEEQLRESEGFEGSVANVASADAIIGSILRKDANLMTVLEENDKQLDQLCEEYIETHCAEAEEMVNWYYDVTAVEDELLGFEKEIEAFQSQLTDTAEDIVSMQAETLQLMKRVDNRKVVSQRLKRVYDALNECEEFCTNIAEAVTVDDEFMINIRELESKISFLADNADLKNSAVHLEIFPKLQASAVRAGDKLHDYLLGKFQGLAEEGTNVALLQQAMERQGQYSYIFLAKYNKPIAKDLYTSYLRIVSDVHAKMARSMCQELKDVTPFSSQLFEPVIQIQLMNILHQAEGSSSYPTQPGYAYALAALTAATPTPATAGASSGGSQSRNASATPARSVSLSLEQRFSKFKDKLHAKFDDRVPATFDDIVGVVQAITFEHQLLHLDPVLNANLKHTTCWLSRFADSMCKMVNAIISESKFISHFFFAAGDSSTDEEENMLRQLVSVALNNFYQPLVLNEINELTCPYTMIGGMRVTELAKNCVSQTPDPLPLLIMAEPFELFHSAFSKRLQSIFSLHMKSLNQANLIKFKKYGGGGASSSSFGQRIENEKPFYYGLGPHEATIAFETILGRIELLNSLPLLGSRVSHITARYVFDDRVSAWTGECFNEYKKLMDSLSKRQESELGIQVFTINNLAAVLLRWRAKRRHYMEATTDQFEKATASMLSGGAGAALDWTGTTLAGGAPKASAAAGGGEGQQQGGGGADNHSGGGTSPPAASGGGMVEPDSPLGTRARQLHGSPTSDQGGSPSTGGGGDLHHLSSLDIPSAQQSSNNHLIQSLLQSEVHKFILQDIATSQLNKWYSTVMSWKEQLGPIFDAAGGVLNFDDDELGELKHQTSELVGTDITEEELLNIATAFHKCWREAIGNVSSRIGGYFKAREPLPSESDFKPATLPQNATFQQKEAAAKQAHLAYEEKKLAVETCNLTCRMILQNYFELILSTNKILLNIAKAYFDASSTLQAKLVGNVTLTHAATNELRGL